MQIYEVKYNDGDAYEPYEMEYGYFSSRDKAEELLKELKEVDPGYEDNYYIATLIVDEVPCWVVEHIAQLRKNLEYFKEES